MKKLAVILILLLVLVTGCAKEEVKQPEIVVIEEPEEKIIVEEEPEEEDIKIEEEEEEPEEEIRIIEIIATENRFIPSEINLTYGENVKLLIKSDYAHNLYVPGLKINKPINKGETEIFIPTYRKGAFTFWCNILHHGSQHQRMKGKIYIR